MKIRKFFAVLCAFLVMMSISSSLHVLAFDSVPPNETVGDSENIDATGLIMSFYLSMATASKQVQITAVTSAYETMAKIGFKDITVQRSTNGSTNWNDEVSISDKIITDALYHSLDHYSVSVTGGYYYRIMLTHYAKEKGWFFPSSQSITNYSNVVWVAAS